MGGLLKPEKKTIPKKVPNEKSRDFCLTLVNSMEDERRNLVCEYQL
jgi:hypothetical protein